MVRPLRRDRPAAAFLLARSSRRGGDPRVGNGETAQAHLEAEFADVVDDIMATLLPQGPYAYTITANTDAPVADGGIPHQPFVTSAAEIRAGYEHAHRYFAVCRFHAVAEIRGDWYVFMHGLGEHRVKDTGHFLQLPTIVLFPTMGQGGITGELFWTRSGVGSAYTGGRAGPLAAEVAVLAQHEELLKRLRNSDAAGVAGLFHPDAQIGIRDYANETGTWAAMHSANDLRLHLDRFFSRFEVQEIALVQRLASDWFVFAELLWVVEERSRPGRRLSFYTAEHSEVRPDGLFATLIGHGTELWAG
jgi:hypothetical protein